MFDLLNLFRKSTNRDQPAPDKTGGSITPSIRNSILSKLKSVVVPNLNKTICELGFIESLEVTSGGQVDLKIFVPSPLLDTQTKIVEMCRNTIFEIFSPKKTNIANIASNLPHDHKSLRAARSAKNTVPNIKNIIAVSSGKGGVGKSSISALLATSFSKLGCSVGVLDVDFFGPSAPRLFGIQGKPLQSYQNENGESKILPVEQSKIKIVSIGSMVEEGQAIIWRGPMLHKVIEQFCNDVDWGNLDYLIIDMPPGTGDTALSIAQLLPITGALVVTSPETLSIEDVRKEISMWEELQVPIIGLVENYSGFKCDSCDGMTPIFSTGGGEFLASKFGLRLVSKIPFSPLIAKSLDQGQLGFKDPVFVELAKDVSMSCAALVAQQIDPKKLLTISN